MGGAESEGRVWRAWNGLIMSSAFTHLKKKSKKDYSKRKEGLEAQRQKEKGNILNLLIRLRIPHIIMS